MLWTSRQFGSPSAPDWTLNRQVHKRKLRIGRSSFRLLRDEVTLSALSVSSPVCLAWQQRPAMLAPAFKRKMGRENERAKESARGNKNSR